MPDTLANTILLGDFGSIENKELVEKELFARIKPKVGSWRNRCYQKTLQAPYKTASFRSVAFPKALDESAYTLLEGVTPDPTGKITFYEQTISVEPKGFYYAYTDQDMQYGFDPIVPLAESSIEIQANDVLDQIAGKAWASGNQVWTCASGLDRETFAKIRISLKKFTRNKNARVKAILSPEDITDLRFKYNKQGANLLQDIPENQRSIIDGALYRFEGVDIEEDDSSFMYSIDPTTGEKGKTRYAYFYILDSQGRLPVGFIKADGTTGEFITKGLGSSGTNDPLNQRGTIGVKFKGVGAMVTAEECLARVEITPASDTIGYINSEYDDFGNITANGEAVARKNVRETASSPKALSLVMYGGTEVKVGETIGFKVFDAKGKDVTSTATWSSGTTANATVTGGVVTGVKAGTSVITVKLTGYNDIKFTVTVVA